MEKIRAKAVTNLKKLNEMACPRYSARELHPKVKPMLQRVKRMEHRRYQEAIAKQRKKVNEDIKQIDKYLKSVRNYNAYLARKAEFESKKVLRSNKLGLFNEVAPIKLSQPKVSSDSMPVLGKTRLPRYTQRRRYK